MQKTAPVPTSSPQTTPISRHTRGTMKFFDFGKGWGFITPEPEGLPDIFVHAQTMSDSGFIRCKRGTPLEVWYNQDAKGLVACRVAPLGELE